MGDSTGRWESFGDDRARSLARVLVFDEGEQGASWASELERAGVRNIVAATADEAELLLASGSFSVAVIGIAIREGRVTRHFTSYGTRIIFAVSGLSARAVLDLSCEGDLVLPVPLEPDTLLRAVGLVASADDDVARFSQTHRLSPRETALLRLALSGKNNDEAAQALGCSRATISSFWNRMFRKTGVSGQRDVVILLHRERSRWDFSRRRSA
jgi:DNA-binding CsgD family transcriptional regulator